MHVIISNYVVGCFQLHFAVNTIDGNCVLVSKIDNSGGANAIRVTVIFSPRYNTPITWLYTLLFMDSLSVVIWIRFGTDPKSLTFNSILAHFIQFLAPSRYIQRH